MPVPRPLPSEQRLGTPASEWVSFQQAAQLVGVSVDTLRRRIRAGKLPAYRFGERLIKIRVEDLDNLVRSIPLGNRLRRRCAS
ncbi:helix-turn-helix domain-containing protein [Micropruina sp.]|uniref:helix-turn-helix domain-containing protein n=1 Tax=Micropruina sp. TaxID=2737536 RepID=UPI0039E3E6BE